MSSTRYQLNKHINNWELTTRWLGNEIVYKPSVSSTQYIAHDLAQEGAKSGTIVVADEQTAGRGRLNRQWQSAKGKGIWMSLIMRPDILPYLAPQLTLLTASAIAKTMDINTPVKPQIKWPNDLFINGKKAAGILTELHTKQNQIDYVIIGIGMNINHDESDFDDTLTQQATSLYQSTGKTWDMTRLIREMLTELEALYTTFISEGFAAVQPQWEHYAYKMDDWVNVRTDNQVQIGIIRGITNEGALKLEISNQIHSIYSGEIMWP